MNFQFSLIRLFLAVTVFAVPFALFRSDEVLGRLVAFTIGVPLLCLALTVDRKQLGSNLLSCLKSLCYLFAPSILALFLATSFINPTPPGGVSWPYYVCLLLVPIAAYWFAGRPSVAVCYGFAIGLASAWPVFVDSRTPLRLSYGHQSEAELLLKILGFATVMALTCTLAYRVRMSRLAT